MPNLTALESEFRFVENFVFRPKDLDGAAHAPANDILPATTTVLYKGYIVHLADNEGLLFKSIVNHLNPTEESNQ